VGAKTEIHAWIGGTLAFLWWHATTVFDICHHHLPEMPPVPAHFARDLRICNGKQADKAIM